MLVYYYNLKRQDNVPWAHLKLIGCPNHHSLVTFGGSGGDCGSSSSSSSSSTSSGGSSSSSNTSREQVVLPGDCQDMARGSSTSHY